MKSFSLVSYWAQNRQKGHLSASQSATSDSRRSGESDRLVNATGPDPWAVLLVETSLNLWELNVSLKKLLIINYEEVKGFCENICPMRRLKFLFQMRTKTYPPRSEAFHFAKKTNELRKPKAGVRRETAELLDALQISRTRVRARN
jgi:hypothetical protein